LEKIGEERQRKRMNGEEKRREVRGGKKCGEVWIDEVGKGKGRKGKKKK